MIPDATAAIIPAFISFTVLSAPLYKARYKPDSYNTEGYGENRKHNCLQPQLIESVYHIIINPDIDSHYEKHKQQADILKLGQLVRKFPRKFAGGTNPCPYKNYSYIKQYPQFYHPLGDFKKYIYFS